MTVQLPWFDPATVPIMGIDRHLPAVDGAMLKPQPIRDRFRRPPTWQPEPDRERPLANHPPRRAAVLMPIVLREEPTVLLTERTWQLTTHAGQIAFPGGKVESEDADAVAAALRETREEIGLESRWIDVVGVLPDYLTGSAFVVTPVVGLVSLGFELKLNSEEVADTFEVPLAYLMNPAHHLRQCLDWQGTRREWLAMPYQDQASTRYIWGVTAALLRNFYRLMAA
ncbi:MAG: CoA pyrophosphatase [Rhodoferax sp.]|nr:CoA pyrophosphatase [Rhodoferax sp.]